MRWYTHRFDLFMLFLFAVILAMFFLSYVEYKECRGRGGEYIKGILNYECVGVEG